MINDEVPPTPGTRKHFGVSAESQRLLINVEPVMSEHSVAALQLEEVSDKVSDKGRPKGTAECPNFRPRALARGIIAKSAGVAERRLNRMANPALRASHCDARCVGPLPMG